MVWSVIANRVFSRARANQEAQFLGGGFLTHPKNVGENVGE